IRSTATPASQSLITVIRPASPPPTTTTRRSLPPSLRIVLFAAIAASSVRASLTAADGVRGGERDVRAAADRALLGAGRRGGRERDPRAGREVDRCVGPQQEDEQPGEPERRRARPLRPPGDRDPPREAEAPEPVGEVEDARPDADDVDEGHDRHAL